MGLQTTLGGDCWMEVVMNMIMKISLDISSLGFALHSICNEVNRFFLHAQSAKVLFHLGHTKIITID